MASFIRMVILSLMVSIASITAKAEPASDNARIDRLIHQHNESVNVRYGEPAAQDFIEDVEEKLQKRRQAEQEMRQQKDTELDLFYRQRRNLP